LQHLIEDELLQLPDIRRATAACFARPALLYLFMKSRESQKRL
jgi:hypothetical protein